MNTVFDTFLATADSDPDQPFLCVPALTARETKTVAGSWTYGAIKAEVLHWREQYRRAGYGHGHRLALLLGMRPAFFVHFLAANALGIGIVPINPDYRHDEMLYQMTHSDADLVVTTTARLAALEQVGRDRDRPLPVVAVEAMPDHLPSPGRAIPQADGPGSETEAGLLYTSGTTGRPKGCMLSNHYYLNAGAWYRGMGGRLTIRDRQDRFYNPLPLHHMNHQAVTAIAAILTHNCLILPDRFSPTRWWQEIAEADATIVHYLGVVPPLLLNQPEVPEEKNHRVRFGLGAGIDPQLHAPFEARFGFPLVEVWGMTETGRIFADHVEPRMIETRAFGRPFGGFEARIVDDSGVEQPRGTQGELVVRASGSDPRRGFFSGYLKNPAATEEAWTGGWFHTGDVAVQDESGMMFFVDRKKNIIRRSGENIAAAEIEAAIQTHDQVAQVAVIAVPDSLREEEVMACIVPMPGTAPGLDLAESVFAWAGRSLAYYKTPGWIVFLPTLPTTGTQKIQKTQIFAAGEDPTAHPGALDFRSQKKRR